MAFEQFSLAFRGLLKDSKGIFSGFSSVYKGFLEAFPRWT